MRLDQVVRWYINMSRLAGCLCLSACLAAVSFAADARNACTGAPSQCRQVFNGKDLTGWKLRHADGNKSWSVLPGGILKNTVEKGTHGTDLVTEQKFWNFTVH